MKRSKVVAAMIVAPEHGQAGHPGDMPPVMAQTAAVPFDMDDPLFKFGFGIGVRAVRRN